MAVNGINLDKLIADVRSSTVRHQLDKTCLQFCHEMGYKHFLLFGTIFTSFVSPPSYIINSPGKAARIRRENLDELIDSCINSSSPVVSANLEKNSKLGNSALHIQKARNSKTLSITFPIHFPTGKFAMFYISTSPDIKNISDKLINDLALVNMFANEAGNAVIRLCESRLENKPPYLSHRERECLLLASDGANTQQISKKVGLSPHTVVFYLKKAREKLHAKNIQGAVGKAILNGDVKIRIGSER